MANTNELLWGVDLGGTKIECAVMERDSHRILIRRRIPTERQHGRQAILERIRELVADTARTLGARPTRLGVATPGTPDPDTELLKNSNTTCLNGTPLRTDLEEQLSVPVTLSNDANCFALAETRLGVVAARHPDARVVFGVILGTGVGGGLIVDDRLVTGRHGVAGEWGHNLLEPDGDPCYCGRRGCVETVISGPALERYYRRLGGSQLGLMEINRRFGTDHRADATIERLVDGFARGIAGVLNVVDPDALVIGGGVGNIDALYRRAPDAIAPHFFNHSLSCPILAPRLGDSAGVIGAALLSDPHACH